MLDPQTITILKIADKILTVAAIIITGIIAGRIEYQKKEKMRKEWEAEQQENQAFRAGIRKSDIPSYEDFKAQKLEEQKKS